MVRKINKHEFWITNISQTKDISLSDLCLTIRCGESRNLLDSKHYSYTLEQLEQSAKSGSIKSRSKFIKVRNIPPRDVIKPGSYEIAKNRIVMPPRHKVDIEVPKYEELDFFEDKDLEERFAADDADIVHNDNAPALAVDEQYVDAQIKK